MKFEKISSYVEENMLEDIIEELKEEWIHK